MSYADPAQEAARVARLAYALGFMGRGIRMLEKRRLYRELTFTPPECRLSSEEIGKKVNELYEFDRLRQAAQVTWWAPELVSQEPLSHSCSCHPCLWPAERCHASSH